jgi:hypothetical protein
MEYQPTVSYNPDSDMYNPELAKAFRELITPERAASAELAIDMLDNEDEYENRQAVV